MCCSFLAVNAQETFLGLNAGIISKQLLLPINSSITLKNGICFGIVAEHNPKKAIFSVSIGANYYDDFNSLAIPIKLRFKPGKKFKIVIEGGILPFIRLNKIIPNKTFSLASTLGMGFEFRVSPKTYVTAIYNIFNLPTKQYTHSHYSTGATETVIERFEIISIGINLKI